MEGRTRRVARKTVERGRRRWHVFSLAFPNGFTLTMETLVNTIRGQMIPCDGCSVSVSFSPVIGGRRCQASVQRRAKENRVFQQFQRCCRRLVRDAWLTRSPPRGRTLLPLFPPSFQKLPRLPACWNTLGQAAPGVLVATVGELYPESHAPWDSPEGSPWARGAAYSPSFLQEATPNTRPPLCLGEQ